MKFSAIYKPTSLFSLKESNSTNSGAKSLLIPSPYAIKMALFNQAITIDGIDNFENKKSLVFEFIKDAKIEYIVNGSFCVNNCFVTIQSYRNERKEFTGKPSFREYIHLSQNIEIIFGVKNEEAMIYLKKYLHRINYFGKRGCFFQFINYNDSPEKPNVKKFDASNFSQGILQEFDDISPKADFKHVNNFDSEDAKRDKIVFVIPVQNINSSKSYTHFKCV